MKVTKSKLKQIIKEEIQSVLNELPTIPRGGGKAIDCEKLIRDEADRVALHNNHPRTAEDRHYIDVEQAKGAFKKKHPECARHMNFDKIWSDIQGHASAFDY